MFQCKACQAKLVNPVRVNCLQCKDVTLCVTCFSNGEEVGEHKNYHDYQVLEQFSFPLFTEDWAADEEELLIEGLEAHGMGNWEDVSGFVRTKSKEECEKHYYEVYYNSDKWPLPKTEPMQSLPSNHEICGYMPLRKEFEMEYENDAELYIKDLEITDKDSQLDFELKKTFEDENYKTKEEKELANKVKPYTQLLCKRDYTTFRDDLIEEDRIKENIQKKIEYRKMGIKTHSESSRYEKQKSQKQINRELAAQPHTGHLTNIPFSSDRLTARSASKGLPVRYNEFLISKKYERRSSEVDKPVKKQCIKNNFLIK
ncbi:18515_t:CDS:2 [Entrophospora sp. SA101]|nr:18515_t:CDS:2 [Entrophospora sp. SA101]